LLEFVALLLGCRGDHDSPATVVRLAEEDVRRIPLPELVAGVVDVLPTEQGRVWILNRFEPYFVLVDSGGALQGAWGDQGDGPAELRNPTSLAANDATGAVWAYDAGKGALVRVSGGDAPHLVTPSQAWSIGDLVSMRVANTGVPTPRLRGLDGGFVLARYSGALQATARLWAAELVVVDTVGAVSTVFRLSDVLETPPDALTRDLFIPHPLWDICPDGDLALYDPSSNAVRRFVQWTTEGESIPLPTATPYATTVERLGRLVFHREIATSLGQPATDSATFFRAFEGEFELFRTRLGDHMPDYVDLRCAESGTWIQPVDPDDGVVGKGRRWWWTSTTGTRPVDFPEGYEPLMFGGDAVWGSLPTPTGAPGLGVIPMSRLGASR
jgi:hypothetical protein